MASTAPEGKKGVPVAVVAGGAGFLGSHLSEALLAQGFHVICLDNYTTGKEENLRHILHHSGFTFKVGDINHSLPDLPRVDYIFHLAGVEEYINGTDVSVETLLVNSIGTKNLLEMARQHKSKILLASSIDLYAGILSSFSLENYFGISKRDEERFSHHEAKRYAEALTTEYFKKFGVDARIVRLADVYGPRMDLRAGTEMAELLAEALQPEAKTLTVHGDGLKVLHPTFVSDVVYGLVKAMTAGETAGKIFNLVSPESQTVLNFASRLRKSAPHHPELTFVDDISETRLPSHNLDLEAARKELGWRPVIGIEEGLKRTLAYFKQGKVVPEVPHVPVGEPAIAAVPQSREYSLSLQPFSAAARAKEVLKFILSVRPARSHSKKRLGIKFATALSLVFITLSVLVPVGGVLVHSGYGAWRLKGSQSALIAGQADSAFAAASSAESAFVNGYNELEDLTWLLSLLHLRDAAENYRHLISSAKEVSTAAKYISQSLRPLLEVGSSLVATDVTAKVSATETNKMFSKASGYLGLADDRLESAQNEFNQVKIQELPGLVRGQAEDVGQKLAEVRTAVNNSRSGVKLLPDLIGLNGPRNYLLLFLNNNEIRPSGGFIGSYGVARFEDGGLRDLFVDDTYNVLEKDNSGIPAPQIHREYLGTPMLVLGNSAWSPDFPTSAASAEALYYHATKKKVDGVIGVDIRAIENILRVIGKISVADYGEIITADNFFERTEFYADVNFFPGSSAKKDFIGQVSRIVIDKILHSPIETWPSLARSLQTSLEEKHLLLYANSADTQSFLSENNWDAALPPVGNPQDSKLGQVSDFLMVVDENIGANKANYYVKPQVNYKVSVDKNGGLVAHLTLLYNHTATSETWPSGKYLDHLQVFAPAGAVLYKAEATDSQAPPTVSTSADLGRTVFSMIFSQPSQTEKTITLTYSLPMKLPSISRESTYNIIVQKQAGQDTPPLSVNFDVPTFLKVSSKDASNPTPYSARVNSTLRTDRTFIFQITP